MNVKIFLGIAISLAATMASADGLKVFGPEFCGPYSAGSCINFHYEDLKDAKNFYGQYKYPKGRKAYDNCAKHSDSTDGSLAYCSMVFHREEQTKNKQLEMCQENVREKYFKTISGTYAMGLYDAAWNCN